jgi:metal-responsive CopG/Arc/MetJ family transcriptional regulator
MSKRRKRSVVVVMVTVKMPSDVVEELRVLSEERDLTVSQIIRSLVYKYLLEARGEK